MASHEGEVAPNPAGCTGDNPTDTKSAPSMSSTKAHGVKIDKPKKGDFRQRAHCNPLADFVSVYPISPDHVDWSVHFPEAINKVCGTASSPSDSLFLNTADHPIEYPAQPVAPVLCGRQGPQVRFLDVGCGYGGLLIALSSVFPDKLMLGLEIREQVTNYVGERIRAHRHGVHGDPSHFNVSVLRTNAMKFLPNYFRKGQLEKMFFCFPDPHFKRKNVRRRIISDGLLSVYAYTLAPGGMLYHATDVEDLHTWMITCCREHPLFEEVEGEHLASDPCVKAVMNETEESKRVQNLGRFGHKVYVGVFRRIESSHCKMAEKTETDLSCPEKSTSLQCPAQGS